MAASWMRGGAGLLFALLGLTLLGGRSGLLVGSAVAAAGCRDNANCMAQRQEEGVVGPEGNRVESVRASCQGDCGDGAGGQTCAEMSTQNADGSRTFQCSCDPNQSPAECSGFATVKANGDCSSFQCLGDCDELVCRIANSIKTSATCPTQYTLRSWCECQ